MILYLEHTRRGGLVGLVFTMAALGSSICSGWPPPPIGAVCWLSLAGAAIFCLHLIAIRWRRVVSLLDGQLVWNTYALRGTPISVPVAQIRRYCVDTGYDGPLDKGFVLVAHGCEKIGFLPNKVHRRIYTEIRKLNPAIIWEEGQMLTAST